MSLRVDPSAMPEEPDELGELSHDAIAGDFRIWQRRSGHRYSLDDVLTAWEAAQVAPGAARCLELGSGIGSVLLMLAYALPHATFDAIEAQRNSFALLTRNVHDNGLRQRVTLHWGDLRTVVTPKMGLFDLVTGTPPYVLPGTATPSSDSQRAYARQEWRGGVEDYLAAAACVLAGDGKAVVCADARTPERVHGCAGQLGLQVVSQRDVVPRAGHKAPLFSVFVLTRQTATASFSHSIWTARDLEGARTSEYRSVRARFGMRERD